MTDRLPQFAEFLVLFDKLKAAAKGDPQRALNFYKESNAVREAVDAMRDFLVLTDFDRRVFHGREKYILQAPERFDLTWKEYQKFWNGIVMSVSIPEEFLDQLVPEWDGGVQDLVLGDEFDPHDGGQWI